MNEPRKLSDEDLARVQQYLNAPGNRRERAPFRPWLLMAVLMLVVTLLSAISMFYAWQHGVRIL